MKLTDFQQIYEKYLQENPFKGSPKNLYDPMNYIMGLGGKRIRPTLALIGSHMTGGNIANSLPVAHAIEVFHNFTLLHDDLMDNSNLRRGKETVHVKWDNPTAILAGDNMLILALEYLQSYEGPNKDAIINIFLKTSREVCEGQQNDMDFGLRENVVSESEYLHMIEQKTAVLLGCALQCGALTGGINESESLEYYDLAINMGLSFQMMDDYLDSFGDSAKTGKLQGGDIKEGKNTWLKIKSFETNAEITGELFKISSKERIDKVINYWRSINLDNRILDKAKMYRDKEYLLMEKIRSTGVDCSVLENLSELLISRQH